MLESTIGSFYQPAMHEVCGQLVLRLLFIFCICLYVYLCVPTYHMRNNYVTYIVAMQPYFSQLWQFRQLATMSSLAQLLRIQEGY